MAYTKIQAKQIQLPIFFSPSGDLNFNDLTTGVDVNLSRNLSGNFNIDGSLRINSGIFFTPDSSHSYDASSGSIVFGGSNNSASGSFNTILAGSGNSITSLAQSNNVILNAINSSITSGSAWNTILAGSGCSFGANITGAVILADVKTAHSNTTSNSLLIDFASGTTFKGGPTVFNSNIVVDSPYSGVFNGEINANGISYLSDAIASQVVTINDVLTTSGALNILGNAVITGNVTSIDSNVFQTGNTTVNGNLIVNSTISGGLITGTQFSVDSVQTNNLNILVTGNLTGSTIATESWVSNQNYVSSLTGVLELNVQNDINVGGTGTFSQVYADYGNFSTGYADTISSQSLSVNGALSFNSTLTIGQLQGGTAINKFMHSGGFRITGVGNGYVYSGYFSGAELNDTVFFTANNIPNQTGFALSRAYAQANRIVVESQISDLALNPNGVITGSVVLIK
jgi:cytoskeletal protein CcmA (bactofilin family)